MGTAREGDDCLRVINEKKDCIEEIYREQCKTFIVLSSGANKS